VNNDDIRHIEWACMRLINQFAVLNDQGQHEQLANLFIEDGRFARPTEPENFIVGREAILASFKARPANKLTRHLISNILIEVSGPDTASGFCYVTQYSCSTATEPGKFGYQANPTQLVGEYFDEFTLSAEGWRFRQRSGRLLMAT
jgi:hypothetical protein